MRLHLFEERLRLVSGKFPGLVGVPDFEVARTKGLKGEPEI